MATTSKQTSTSHNRFGLFSKIRSFILETLQAEDKSTSLETDKGEEATRRTHRSSSSSTRAAESHEPKNKTRSYQAASKNGSARAGHAAKKSSHKHSASANHSKKSHAAKEHSKDHSLANPKDVIPHVAQDPAHSPGHRRLNIKDVQH